MLANYWVLVVVSNSSITVLNYSRMLQ
jgi:hypothetical protein